MLARRSLSLLVFLLASCSQLPAPGQAVVPGFHPRAPSPAYQPQPAAHEGGTVVLGDWESPSNFAPLFNDEVPAAQVNSLLYAGLARLDADLEWIPDLAARLPTVESGDVALNAKTGSMDVTYHLRPGLRWSDGTPLTSSDVVYTWRVIVDPQVAGVLSTDGYDAISRITVSDQQTFVLHFDRPYPRYLELFSAILPEHRLRDISGAHLADDPFWVRPDVVSGPFMISEVVPDEHITLVRNPAWAQGRRGLRPHLDSIIYRIYPDLDQLLAAARAGEVDVALEIPDDGLSGMQPGPMVVQQRPSLAYEQVTFNQQDPNPVTGLPPLWQGDPALLRALRLAVDRAGMVQAVFRGRARIADSPIPSGLSAYHDATVRGDGDPDLARRLLDQDGWLAGPDGIRVKNGRRLSFTITTALGNPLRLQVQGRLIADWRRAGVQVTTRDARPGELFSGYAQGGLLEHGQFETGLWTWSIGPDPDGVYPIDHSSQIPGDQNQGRGSNFGRVHSPEIDRALELGRVALDEEGRVRAYEAFQQAFARLGAELPLYERGLTVLSRARLHNLVLNPAPDTTLWNAADWWVDR